MNNVVTYETAVKLKAAGFPQPEPQAGQFWYKKHPSTAITLDFVQSVEYNQEGEKQFYTLWVGTDDTGGNFYTIKNHKLIFAPTATDILEQLPGYEIGFFPTAKDLYFLPGAWSMRGLEDECPSAEHDNPAEAAALAWLKLNEKK